MPDGKFPPIPTEVKYKIEISYLLTKCKKSSFLNETPLFL